MLNLFKPRQRAWRTPDGDVYTVFLDMAAQPHLLIAGATGSGKSVLENGILYTVLHDSPARVQLILLDPKRTELQDYAHLPHVLRYAYEPGAMIEALQRAVTLLDARLDDMQRRRLRIWDGPRLYVVIDEFTDLLLTLRKQARPLIQRICQLGRAAGIAVIGCCQNLLERCLPTEIRCNFPAVAALKTATRQQSRFISGRPGCELFPYPPEDHVAYCYYIRGCKADLYTVPTYTPEQYARLLSWWTSPACVA